MADAPELSAAIEEAIDALAAADETARFLRDRVDALVAVGIPVSDALGLAWLGHVSVRDCRALLERGCPRNLIAEILA
jgi:hypothetical protein